MSVHCISHDISHNIRLDMGFHAYKNVIVTGRSKVSGCHAAASCFCPTKNTNAAISCVDERSHISQSDTMLQKVICTMLQICCAVALQCTVQTAVVTSHVALCAETGILSPGGCKGAVQVQPAGDCRCPPPRCHVWLQVSCSLHSHVCCMHARHQRIAVISSSDCPMSSALCAVCVCQQCCAPYMHPWSYTANNFWVSSFDQQLCRLLPSGFRTAQVHVKQA